MMAYETNDSTAAIASAARAGARSARKQQQLRRMQRLTLALLGASLALLALSVLYQPRWPWLRWLQAFAEASAIGAMADWYAVVALFRRPLGLPIPHTAIIPENKNSIGESLGEFVSGHLLTPANIVGKLGQYDGAGLLARWLASPGNAAGVARSFTNLLPALLRAPEDADLRRFFEQHVAPKLLELDAARATGRLMEHVIELGLHRAVFERGLALADRWLARNEPLLREKFAQASRYTPGFFDAYMVRKFLEGVHALVRDVAAEPAHPLRAQFEDVLRELALGLGAAPEYREAVRDWLRELVRTLSNDEDLRRLRDRLATRIEADLAAQDSLLRQYATALIIAVAQGVVRDQPMRDRLNGAWLRLAGHLASRHGGQVATLIAEVVRSWDAAEVAAKVELEIGRDLQFIRINGALVGGTVGVALHACALLLR